MTARPEPARPKPKPRPRRVTARWLLSRHACQKQVELFIATFGVAVDLTAEAVARAADVGLDLDWFAFEVLGVLAWARYERAGDAAWAEYARAIAPAHAEYARIKALARADFRRAIAPALIAALGLGRETTETTD